MSQPENNPIGTMLTDAVKSAASAGAALDHILKQLPEEQLREVMAKIGPDVQKAQREIEKLNEQVKNFKV